MSRRRHDRSKMTQSPTLTTTDEFSDQELDFFKRGDELSSPPDTNETPDSDA